MTKSVFLATYFTGNGETGAYLAISEDGLRFRPLLEPNVPLIRPLIGKDKLMRDPCLAHGPDGRWHLTWTTGWWDRHIGLAHSDDLLHWSEQTALPVMEHEPGALNAWAPELIYDRQGKRFVLYWSSTIPGRFPETDPPSSTDTNNKGKPLNHRFYYTETKDFKSFTPTKLLWDPGFNCIDATLIADGKQWLLVGKDETKVPEPHKFLFTAQGKSASGPFKITAPRITGNFWAEGPTVVKVGKRWRVYFDCYTEHRWGAVESENGRDWTDISDKIQMVPGARHGTVQYISSDLVSSLRKALS